MVDDSERKFTFSLRKTGPMEFTTTFDRNHFPELRFDEPEHAGGADQYPNASRVLAAAVANCLGASLTFCLEKAKMPLETLTSVVTAIVRRNAEGYWRVAQIDVELTPTFPSAEFSDRDLRRVKRCVNVFKNYCIVSMSVQEGIPVHASVHLPDGSTAEAQTDD